MGTHHRMLSGHGVGKEGFPAAGSGWLGRNWLLNRRCHLSGRTDRWLWGRALWKQSVWRGDGGVEPDLATCSVLQGQRDASPALSEDLEQ